MGQRPGYRLALVCDSVEMGGAEGFLRTLTAALGAEVEVVLIGRDRAVLEAIARPPLPRVPEVVVVAPWEVRPIMAALRAAHPDVVHLNLTAFGACRPAFLAASALRLPVVLVDHAPTPGLNWRGHAMQRAMSAAAAARVSVGERSSRDTERFGRLPAGSVGTIRNGIRPLPARPPLSPATGRVGAVGRLAEVKGFDLLVRAVAAMPGVQLSIAGDGPQAPALRRLATELGVADRVHLLGRVDDIGGFLADIDVLAMPSHQEALPLALLEAMHVGTPVVASAVGSIPDVVVDGTTGLLVPPGDLGALRAALGRLLGDDALRQRLATTAQEYAGRELTDTAMAAAYDAVYRRAAGLAPLTPGAPPA